MLHNQARLNWHACTYSTIVSSAVEVLYQDMYIVYLTGEFVYTCPMKLVMVFVYGNTRSS